MSVAQAQRRSTGRPVTKAVEGQKATLGIRASASLKDRLFEAATRNGRSLSAEAETRLELSFAVEAVREMLRHVIAEELTRTT
jgi:hypothetical protein